MFLYFCFIAILLLIEGILDALECLVYFFDLSLLILLLLTQAKEYLIGVAAPRRKLHFDFAAFGVSTLSILWSKMIGIR